MEELRKVADDATEAHAISQQTSTILLVIFVWATIAMIVFLTCSLSMMSGLKRELSKIGRSDDLLGPPPPAGKSPAEY